MRGSFGLGCGEKTVHGGVVQTLSYGESYGDRNYGDSAFNYRNYGDSGITVTVHLIIALTPLCITRSRPFELLKCTNPIV
jgi:hypothetical protein